MAMRLVSPLGERERQDALLELLNSTPVVNGVIEDRLADPQSSRSWQRAHGGTGTAEERAHILQARAALQAVARGEEPAASLAPLLDAVAARPRISSERISWEIRVPPERRLAVEMVMLFDAVQEAMPGRLRPCANPECRLYVLDRSKANSARWCSMAVCGNRMKARLHYQRTRGNNA
ncbi:CGNR zinc finger domain-containing protein [Streptomyces sp. NPDC002143]